MNLSRFFIDRPIFAGVTSILIFLAGAVSVFQLPISEYLEVMLPTVVVKAQFPGANPKVIAEAEVSLLAWLRFSRRPSNVCSLTMARR
jgi:multidrug efflux pump